MCLILRTVLAFFGTIIEELTLFSLFLFEKRIHMTSINPLITSAEEQFIVGESDFSYFEQNAHRLEGCAILFCREGHAEVMVDQCHGRLQCGNCKADNAAGKPQACQSGFSQRQC